MTGRFVFPTPLICINCLLDALSSSARESDGLDFDLETISPSFQSFWRLNGRVDLSGTTLSVNILHGILGSKAEAIV